VCVRENFDLGLKPECTSYLDGVSGEVSGGVFVGLGYLVWTIGSEGKEDESLWRFCFYSLRERCLYGKGKSPARHLRRRFSRLAFLGFGV
jgi:hypothetical protein